MKPSKRKGTGSDFHQWRQIKTEISFPYIKQEKFAKPAQKFAEEKKANTVMEGTCHHTLSHRPGTVSI